MLKIIQKYLDISVIKLSTIIALLYFVLFNTPIVLSQLVNYKAEMLNAILTILHDSIVVYAGLCIMFFGLSINTLLFLVVAHFLFFTGAIASYYFYFFNVVPNIEIIRDVFHTDITQIQELVTTKLILWLIFSMFVCTYTIRYFKISETKLFLNKLVSAICLLLTVYNMIFLTDRVLNKFFPFQYIHNTYSYLTHAVK